MGIPKMNFLFCLTRNEHNTSCACFKVTFFLLFLLVGGVEQEKGCLLGSRFKFKSHKSHEANTRSSLVAIKGCIASG